MGKEIVLSVVGSTTVKVVSFVLVEAPSKTKLTFVSALISLLNTHLSPVLEYVSVALAPSTVIPAPSAAALSAAPLAIVILRSSTSNVVLFIAVSYTHLTLPTICSV